MHTIRHCRPRFAVAAVLFLVIGTGGCGDAPRSRVPSPQSDSTSDPSHVQILGEVVGVEIIPTPSPVTRRFAIRLRVMHVIRGEDLVGFEPEVAVKVHSVALSFYGHTPEDVIGKKYIVTYLGAYSRSYAGELDIQPEDGEKP